MSGKWIENSYNIGDINVEINYKSMFIGGIFGEGSGALINDYNSGNITTTNGIVGGIVGRSRAGLKPIKITCCYFEKNSNKNSVLTSIGQYSYYNNDIFQMIGCFDFIRTTDFTYTNNTTEMTGYEGDLLTKLNKYVTDNKKDDYLSWKMDENIGYPVLVYNEN